ncbi:lipoate--protein ligase family protein [Alkalibacillus almallahensis]|uniref:lipoate--protein ligase family protein n=1 Tax=Alkalibacillus almallahensis TaxID=1379154 RepID=UPI00141F7059|nr:biotin/lipoate A/B protein ligase family protein [Alkalibacillus almallahensis]
MAEEWFVIEHGLLDADVNMAVDECLLNWQKEGKMKPTLRFYGWTEPSLSVGQFQSVEQSIDFESVEAYHCQFVRRLTGGSAVLHDDELTYSIVLPEDHQMISSSIKDAYYTLSQGLVKGFEQLGIRVEHATPSEQSASNRSDVCFERPAYYELLAQEKKLSGNAQIRKDGVLLQHGSIPLTLDTTMLFDLFRFPNEEFKNHRRQLFKEKATTINQLNHDEFNYDDVKNALKKGFDEAFDVKLVPYELTKEQWDEVYQLVKFKYGNDNWNFKRNRQEA